MSLYLEHLLGNNLLRLVCLTLRALGHGVKSLEVSLGLTVFFRETEMLCCWYEQPYWQRGKGLTQW